MLSILSLLPVDKRLEQVVASYSFVEGTVQDFSETYTHFPSLLATLNVYYSAEVQLRQNVRIVEHSMAEAPVGVLTNGFLPLPLISNIRGCYKSVIVAFHPLGVQRIKGLSLPLKTPAKKVSIPTFWSQSRIVNTNFQDTNACAALATELDRYFVPLVQTYPHDWFANLLADLVQHDCKLKLQQLAKVHGKSRRTILRWFKKHLGCSYESFVQIYRFRCALKKYYLCTSSPTLTDLAYLGGYYDQSDMIHQFKRTTGHTPKEIVSNMRRFANQGLYWDFGGRLERDVITN